MTDWTSSFTFDQSLTCQQAAVPSWKTETQAGVVDFKVKLHKYINIKQRLEFWRKTSE